MISYTGVHRQGVAKPVVCDG